MLCQTQSWALWMGEETAYKKAVVRMEIPYQEKRKPELDGKYWGCGVEQ